MGLVGGAAGVAYGAGISRIAPNLTPFWAGLSSLPFAGVFGGGLAKLSGGNFIEGAVTGVATAILSAPFVVAGAQSFPRGLTPASATTPVLPSRNFPPSPPRPFPHEPTPRGWSRPGSDLKVIKARDALGGGAPHYDPVPDPFPTTPPTRDARIPPVAVDRGGKGGTAHVVEYNPQGLAPRPPWTTPKKPLTRDDVNQGQLPWTQKSPRGAKPGWSTPGDAPRDPRRVPPDWPVHRDLKGKPPSETAGWIGDPNYRPPQGGPARFNDRPAKPFDPTKPLPPGTKVQSGVKAGPDESGPGVHKPGPERPPRTKSSGPENPPKVLKPVEGTGHAGEGGWSPEATARMQHNRFFRRTSDGRMVEITDPTAIDTPPGRRETIVVQDKNTGHIKDIRFGDGIRPNEKTGLRNRIEDQVGSAGATDKPGDPPRKVDNEGDPNVVTASDAIEQPPFDPASSKLVAKPQHPGINPADDVVGARTPPPGSKPWSSNDPNHGPVQTLHSAPPKSINPATIDTSPSAHFYGHDALGRPVRVSAWLQKQPGTDAVGRIFGDLERGHLNPNQYGGRGDFTVPMTKQANTSYVRSIENAAAPYLKDGYAVKLDVEVTHLPGAGGTMPDRILHNLTVVDPSTGRVITTIRGNISAAEQNTAVSSAGPGVVSPRSQNDAAKVMADDSAVPGSQVKISPKAFE